MAAHYEAKARLCQKTASPASAGGCYHLQQTMSNRNVNSTEKALGILRILYPDADEYELERNLYFPLKRCLSIQSDLCASFPECMCGRDVLAATFGDQPPPPATSGSVSSGGSGLF